MMELSCDFISDIIDEISLEGLEGITLQGLWLRLSQRPRFIYKPIDDHIQRFLWKIIAKISCLQFYKLPSERQELVVFNRTDYVDACGNFYEPENMPPCIYAHEPIDDNGTMGSCFTYSTRVNVTKDVRNEDFDTAQRRGYSLIMVADQNLRSRALCGPDFNPATELGLVPYCILERIGRSRYEGEVTQGKHGLQMVTEDSKMLYYFRKLLVKHKLVLKQVFFMKIAKQTSTGSLLHLTRFYAEMKTRQDADAIKLIKYLEDSPMKCMPLKSIRSQLNVEVKKLLMKYPKNFKTALVPYRVMNPSSKPNDWKLKSTGEERNVRVMKLINSSISKDEEEEDDDEEDVGILDESQRRLDRTLMRQAYYIVEQSGPRGIKQAALGSLLAVPSLQSRSVCKHLVKHKLVNTGLVDVGRQRMNQFYCSKFDSSETSLISEIQEEKNKFLQAISVNSTICERKTSVPNEANSSIVEEENGSQEIIKQCETETELPVNSNCAEDIKAEIIISKPDTGENSKGLTEELKCLDESSSSVTAKMLKRASIIVQSVNLHKVIQDTQKVQRIVSEEEESEGLKQTIDRKTIQRLLDKLESDGLLKTIKVNLKGYGREKSMLFICHPSVNESHSEIQSAIEQAKMKLPIISAHHTKKNLRKVSQKPKLPNLKYDMKAGRSYGYKPKFVRMRILHSYMYYLIYGYDGDPKLDQSCKKEIISKFSFDSSLLDELPFVYRNEVDWKMFLPPLPIHTEYTTGWCLLSDVLLRLPLYLFVSIVNVPYSIPGLMDFINHPIKRYILVKELPTEILHHLTLMRKYIFVVSDIVARLGFIGLIQMGPQKLKEKDQVFIYMNKHALLYNTTTSEVGYNHISKDKNYECIKYEFMTIDDVEQYWCDLWNFAMNTNLGNRNSMTGKPIVVESVNTKKELLSAIQTKTTEEAKACDVGYIPGDNLGAGGLDSDMFVHLKRNWYWTGKKIEDAGDQSTLLYPPVIKQHSKGLGHKEVGTKKYVSRPMEATKEKDKDVSVPSKNQKVDVMAKSKGSKQTLNSGWKSRAVSKKKTRILKQRKTKFPRKPYYDQKDKDALSRMVKLRVDWSSTEDNLLLICKVASLYMSPLKRRQVVKNFCAVREMLHSTYPTISRNKTSRACQRRMHYMMRNPFTAQSVYMCLEEIKQDPEIHSKFHRAVEKLDALLKSQGEGPKGYQEEYDKIFMNLVSTLLKKLKTVTNPEKTFFEVKLPDTVAEFMKNYNPFIPKPHILRNKTFIEVNKVLDIMASVINSVIHSSLCCATEKTSYSNQLFYIYQQYPDKLLRYVMVRCRSMQIISCSKQYKRWKSMGFDCLPLASSPYQLSITYVHILQSKYQYHIFSDCYIGLKSLLHNGGNNTSKRTQSSSKENKEKQNQKAIVNIEVKTGGQCANVVELFTSGLIEMNVEFPDQLIVLDPRLSETEERYKLIMKRFKEMLTIIKESRRKENKTLLSEDEEDEEDIGEDNIQTDDKEPYFEQFNLKNKTGVANTASRLALYLMRDEPLEQLDQNIQHAHDFFVLNPCKVTVELDQKKAEEFIFYKDLKTKVIADIKRFATFPEEKPDNEQICTFLEMKKSLVLPLLEFLESKCELGATYDDLKAQFEEERIKEVLISLVENQFILKTGLIAPRFIHNKYTKPWLVKSFFLHRLTRESLGAEKTNSAYAISFGDSESSTKRKQKSMANNSSKQSLDADGLPKKKIKLDTSLDEGMTVNSGASTSTQSTSKDNDGFISPPKKKLKTEGTPLLDQESNNKSCVTMDNSTTTENISDPVPSTSQEKAVENDHHSRFLVRTTNRKWIAVPNENMKKFSNFNPSDANVVYVSVRPWIKIDGTLNRRVLDRLLGSVLGHCLFCPGIAVTRLQERFTPALQPAHTYELVEILQKIKCVQLVELKKAWKATLFSKRVPITPDPAEGLGSTTNVIVEPDPFAVSRLGYFIGDKTYSIDYLAQLSYCNKDGLIL